ncbi:MAG TPA: HlyD family efflux transporter periplasmic adaptor subunit [Planctomycetota bacterium]|nr:HlyD family efflux transporter periplasmic adaptor subunit [Planctomycetota bacterium]
MHARVRQTVLGITLVSVALCTAACARPDDGTLQGYVEGEFVFVASPLGGELQQLAVQRGSLVKKDELLFALEDTTEREAKARQQRIVDSLRSRLEDEKKGKRPSEIKALEALLEQNLASQKRADAELVRVEKAAPSGAVSLIALDRARAELAESNARVAQSEADLATARLGAREDRVAAAEAEVRAAEAELVRRQWDLDQKRQTATADALVFDTIYREGEWVEAGRPVVALLPPGNVKVRTFVPETRVGAIRIGASASVHIDGVEQPARGSVTFVSPRAEYTPPVIFSRESRSKLVFLVEIRFAPETASQLHPGQPVDVRLEGRT